MYDEQESPRGIYLLSAEDDFGAIEEGSLIPPRKQTREPDSPGLVASFLVYVPRRVWLLPIVSMLILTVFFTSLGYTAIKGVNSLANPTVIIENPYSRQQIPLNYGVELALSRPAFFTEARNTFIYEEETFLELDLLQMQARFFENGVLTFSAPILQKAKEGSVFEVPAGMYNVSKKTDSYESRYSDAVFPWTLTFSGNYHVHGQPEVSEEVALDGVGGIHLKTADAEALYRLVGVDTTVLVQETYQESDEFLYEPKVPELDTPHYLIADLESNTVLASSDLDAIAPIASLTKLMTALVVIEELNLDETIWIDEPSLVQSLIPRLAERSRASVYSLLQLLLIESSNEAADILANEIGYEQFIMLMNAKADAIGLSYTEFADPSGLSSENVSSVGDLLRLTKYISQHHRFILDLTADQSVATAYTGDEFGELVNFNQVAGLDNFIGGKVGETIAAGQTSVTLHRVEIKKQPRTLVVVLLGSSGRNADVTELIEYAETRF